MNWVLIIWLAVPSNYTVYDKFETLKACQEKRDMVTKALTQANSDMRVTCRRLEDLVSEYDPKTITFPIYL